MTGRGAIQPGKGEELTKFACLVRAGLPCFRLYREIPLAAFGHPARRPKGLISAQAKIEPCPETLAEARNNIERHRDKAMPIVRAED